MLFKCKCGDAFNTQRRLTEHIALQNPHWPRSHPDDKHRDIAREAYKIRQRDK